MTAQSQLEAYLGEFRRRLKALIVARGAALLAIAALAVTLLAVYFGIRRAFDPQLVIGARIVLLLLLAGIAVTLVALPLRALRRSRGIGDIERRAPDFNGRLETYDGIVNGPPERATPFLGLLAEDALNLARRIPVALKVPDLHVRAPAAIAILGVRRARRHGRVRACELALRRPASLGGLARRGHAAAAVSRRIARRRHGPPRRRFARHGNGRGLRAASHGSIRAVPAGCGLGKRADGPHGGRQLRLHVLRAARAAALLRPGCGTAQSRVRGRRRRSAANHELEAHL